MRGDREQTCSIELRYGRLRLRTLAFEAPAPVRAVTVNRNRRAAFTTTGTRVLVTLSEPITLTGAPRSGSL